MNHSKLLSIVVITVGLFATAGSVWTQSKTDKPQAKVEAKTGKPLVTFIELGSVKCIPCRMMQPVMQAIEKKYGDQMNVVFYDVWTPAQQHYAAVYRIRVIPTQVFLNKEGKELFRHEGFFPEAEIDKLLQKHGLNLRRGR